MVYTGVRSSFHDFVYRILAGAVVILACVGNGAADGHDDWFTNTPFHGMKRYAISTCDDLPSGRNQIQGLVLVGGDVICEETKVLEIAQDAQSVFFIGDRGARLNMKGVRFVVREGTAMHFVSGAWVFERHEGDEEAIFEVDGHLSLDADDHGYNHAIDGILSDQKSAIRVGRAGNLDPSENTFLYLSGNTVTAVSRLSPKSKNRLGQLRKHPERPQQHQREAEGLSQPTEDSGAEDDSSNVSNIINIAKDEGDGSDLSSMDTGELLTEDGNTLVTKLEERQAQHPLRQPHDQQKQEPHGRHQHKLPPSTTSDEDETNDNRTDLDEDDNPNLDVADVRKGTAAVPPREPHQQQRQQQDQHEGQHQQEHQQEQEQQQQQNQPQRIDPRQQLDHDESYHRDESPTWLETNGNIDSAHGVTNASSSSAELNEAAEDEETRTNAGLHPDDIVDVRVYTLTSCDELTLPRITLSGFVVVEGNIICEEERVIEITDKLVIVSTEPTVHTKGVYFHVRTNAALSFAMPKMVFERIQGHSAAIFTVESQGSLKVIPDEWGMPKGEGTEEDTRSLMRVEDGGLLDIDGHVDFTASTMTVVMRPLTKDPSWILDHQLRRRRRWEQVKRERQQHHHQEQEQEQEQEQKHEQRKQQEKQQQEKQQQEKQQEEEEQQQQKQQQEKQQQEQEQQQQQEQEQQQQEQQNPQQHPQPEEDGVGPTLSAPAAASTYGGQRLFHSPFTPHVSAKYTFAQRLNLSPARIEVGEELRFPSSMTDALTGSVLSLGVDGSLLLSRRDKDDLQEGDTFTGSRWSASMDMDMRLPKNVETPKTVVAADFAKARTALFERASSKSMSNGRVEVEGMKGEDGYAGRNAGTRGGDEGTEASANASQVKGRRGDVAGRRGWFGTAQIPSAETLRRRGRRVLSYLQTRPQPEKTAREVRQQMRPHLHALSRDLPSLRFVPWGGDDVISVHVLREPLQDMFDSEGCSCGMVVFSFLSERRLSGPRSFTRAPFTPYDSAGPGIPITDADVYFDNLSLINAARVEADSRNDGSTQGETDVDEDATADHGIPEAGKSSGPTTSPTTIDEDSSSGGYGPLRYSGDDVALKVTTTGSVVVTIGGHVVLEKNGPRREEDEEAASGWMAKLRREVDLVRLAMAAVLRRDHRNKNISDNDNITGNGTDDVVVSDGYALHVVEKGFEVWLEGDFVWGSYVG